MSRYELYLFIHIAAAVIWVGGGFMLLVLSLHAAREDAKLGQLMEATGGVADRVFIPSSLTVVVMGILMIVDGPWSFDNLWLILGLIGYLATFITGIFVMKPMVERINAIVERDGHFSGEAAVATRRFLALTRIDTIVLFLIVADMALKPTGDDVGVLVAMALVLLAGIAYVVARVRAIDAQAAPATA